MEVNTLRRSAERIRNPPYFGGSSFAATRIRTGVERTATSTSFGLVFADALVLDLGGALQMNRVRSLFHFGAGQVDVDGCVVACDVDFVDLDLLRQTDGVELERAFEFAEAGDLHGDVHLLADLQFDHVAAAEGDRRGGDHVVDDRHGKVTRQAGHRGILLGVGRSPNQRTGTGAAKEFLVVHVGAAHQGERAGRRRGAFFGKQHHAGVGLAGGDGDRRQLTPAGSPSAVMSISPSKPSRRMTFNSTALLPPRRRIVEETSFLF